MTKLNGNISARTLIWGRIWHYKVPDDKLIYWAVAKHCQSLEAGGRSEANLHHGWNICVVTYQGTNSKGITYSENLIFFPILKVFPSKGNEQRAWVWAQINTESVIEEVVLLRGAMKQWDWTQHLFGHSKYIFPLWPGVSLGPCLCVNECKKRGGGGLKGWAEITVVRRWQDAKGWSFSACFSYLASVCPILDRSH